MHIYIYIFIYIYLFIYMYIYMYACAFIYIYICVCVCVCAYIFVIICIWATVEIYCLRQVRHQVSESPIVLQAFLFLHILTTIYICLSIVLKHVHLDPHPWRSLFARVGAHLRFCPCLSGPPSRCLGGVFNQQVFWKENGFWHALATHSC